MGEGKGKGKRPLFRGMTDRAQVHPHYAGGITTKVPAAPNGDLDGQSNPLGRDQNFPDAKIVVYTKNVRSLRIHSPERIAELLAELSDVEWDVVLLSETRALSQSLVLDGGHLLYTELDENKFAGVGILLHSKHVRKSNKMHAIGGRIMALDFMVNKMKVRVVAVYLPHIGYGVPEFNDTFDQLRCVVEGGRR